MDLKFIFFLVACMVALWVFGGTGEPRYEEEEASPGSKEGATFESVLEGLYQLEG